MVAQHNRGRANANVPRLAALQLIGDPLQIPKKGLDEFVQLGPGGRQFKRPALKQRRAQKFLQLGNLRAHRRLLDAIGNVPHRRHDAAVPGHVIKQFEVMDVHGVAFCSYSTW